MLEASLNPSRPRRSQLFPAYGAAPEEAEHDGEHEEDEECGAHQAADDHYRQGLLAFAADPRAGGGRHQAQPGHQGGHHHGADAGANTIDDGAVHRHAQREVVVELGDEDHAVLHADAEERDEAHTGGDPEVHAGDVQCDDAADQGKGHVDQHQPCIAHIPQGDEKDHENGHQADGYHLCQSVGCAHLVLEFAGPLDGVAGRQFHVAFHVPACFGDGATEVAVAHGELHADEAAVVVAVDERWPGVAGDGSYLLQGDAAATERGHQGGFDLIFALAVLVREADTDVEFAFALIHHVGRFAADGHFQHGLGIGGAHAVQGHLGIAQSDLYLGLAEAPRW